MVSRVSQGVMKRAGALECDYLKDFEVILLPNF